MEFLMEDIKDPEGSERRQAIYAVAVAQTDYLRDAHAARTWGWVPFFGKRLRADWARSRRLFAQTAARASLIVGELHLEGIDFADLDLIKQEYERELSRCTPDTDQFPEIIGDGSEDIQ